MDETLFVRLCGWRSHGREILWTVLETYIVDAKGGVAFVRNHKVGHAIRSEIEGGCLSEPLVTLVTTETSHHGIGGSTTGRLLWLDSQLDASQNLTCSTLLTNAEFGIVGCFDTHNEVAIVDDAEVYVVVFEPAALSRQGCHIATESIDGIDKLGGHTFAGTTVAVNLNFLSSLVDTNATHGLLYFLDGSVRIEEQFINLYATALVITGREGILVIEQIPLAFIVDNAVVVGPAAILMLWHDNTLVFVGPHWVLTHGIAEHFGFLPHVWIGEVVPAVGLEGKWAFGLTVRQVFQAVDTHHLHLAVAPLNGFLGIVICQFLHVGLELGTTSVAPENIGIAVGLDQCR